MSDLNRPPVAQELAVTSPWDALRSWPGAVAFTGLTCLAAQLAVPLPMTPVPVTLQVFAVLLSGLFLGRKWGAVAQAQYLMLGAAGAPVFALGQGGMHVLLGVTGGYLLACPFAAALTGYLAESARRGDGGRIKLFFAAVAGVAPIYAVGCGWLALATGRTLSLPAVLMAGAGWFLAWDLVKAMVASLLAAALIRPRR